MFQHHALQLRREDDQVGIGRIGFHDQHRFDTIVARLDMREGDPVVEQKDFHFLGAVGEQQDVDVRMLAGRPVEDRAGKIGRIVGEQFEQAKCRPAQGEDQLGMPFLLVQAAVGAQFRLDLRVVRVGRPLGQAKLASRLALGVVIVGDAVLGHQAGGGAGDAGPGAGAGSGPFMVGHAGSIRVESPPF